MNATISITSRAARIAQLVGLLAVCAVAVVVLAAMGLSRGDIAPAGSVRGQAAQAAAPASGVLAPMNTPTATAEADVKVSKTDGVSVVSPGQYMTYTVFVTNTGPLSVFDMPFRDYLPPQFVAANSQMALYGGADVGDLVFMQGYYGAALTLPVGARIVVSITGALGGASGSITNTALVTIPAGMVDPAPADNIALDVDAVGAGPTTTDAQVTKGDGVSAVSPGQPLTYTVVITNAGPAVVNDLKFTDFFPSGFTAASANAFLFGGATSGSGSFGLSHLNWAFTLPVSSRVVISIGGVVNGNASGWLTNTAVITLPAGLTDTSPANNTAFDVDSVGAGPNTTDAQVSKGDGVSAVTPGQPLTYTVVVTNVGPAVVNGLQFADFFPPGFSPSNANVALFGGATAGQGSLGSSQLTWAFTLPAGARAVIAVTGTVNIDASGWLTNTAVITLPAGVTDTLPANNVALDVDSVGAGPSTADLKVSKTDGVSWVSAGQALVYTVRVTNTGPGIVNGMPFSDTFSAAFVPTLAQFAGSAGASLSGISLTATSLTGVFTMPPGSRFVITLTGSVAANATGWLTNTAWVVPPAGMSDPSPGDLLAIDIDLILRRVYVPATTRDGSSGW